MISAHFRGKHRVLFAAFALVSISACKHRASQNSAAPSASVTNLAPAPSLRVAPAEHDFGSLAQGAVVKAQFELTNTGAAALSLARTTDALDCHGEIAPTELEPSAKAMLTVECHAKYHGPLTVALPVLAIDGVTSLAELKLSGNVTPRLAFDSPLVNLKMPFDEARSTVVHLTGSLATSARLTFADDGNAGIYVETLPVTAGTAPAFRLTVKGRHVGTFVGNLVGTTNLSEPRELRLPYSVIVTGDLRVTPETPFFDLRAPGGDTLELVVSSQDPKFALQKAEIVAGPFEASFKRDASKHAYRVLVTLRRARIESDARGQLGKLVLQSNDRPEPKKEIPLFALGQANPVHDE